MKSINLNLEKHLKSGLLKFYASRPTMYGLEMHLVAIYKAVKTFSPQIVVLDPISNLIAIGSFNEVKAMLVRLIDFLLADQITVMFTTLTLSNTGSNQSDEEVSSLVDAWIQIKDIEMNGERNRGLYVMKARGMSHSNQVREFVITDTGLNLVDVYVGPDGILTGSARKSQIMLEETGEALYSQSIGRKDREISRKRKLMESKIENLKTRFESVEEELNRNYLDGDLKKKIMEETRGKMKDMRGNVSNKKSQPKPGKKK
jgi:circadian clock protein KaiC